MTDDFLAGVVPDDDMTGDADFDPNAVESDDFLDDPKDLGLDGLDDLDDDLLADMDDDDFSEDM